MRDHIQSKLVADLEAALWQWIEHGDLTWAVEYDAICRVLHRTHEKLSTTFHLDLDLFDDVKDEVSINIYLSINIYIYIYIYR
jgi:hypothetical protein